VWCCFQTGDDYTFDEILPLLRTLSESLKSTESDPALGFMIDSLIELLKALIYAQELNERVIHDQMMQYSSHTAGFVQQRLGLVTLKSEKSLIDALGSDLCG
jgi:hypothetical protein